MSLQFGNCNLTTLRCPDILSSKCRKISEFQTPDLSKEVYRWFEALPAERLRMKQRPSYTKLRGGYYTPRVISDFLAAWAIRSRNTTVLEPSCGDGLFIEAIADRMHKLRASKEQIARQITAYEIDDVESAKATFRLRSRGIEKRRIQIHTGDFFGALSREQVVGRYDAVLGNPPFVRYQDFPEEQRVLAFALMKQAGLKPNRLTNAWVPFLVAAALSLKSNGRLGMVIPAELLQVNYAADLRLFLSNYFTRIRVLTFRRLAFRGVQQEIVLLLAERGNRGSGGIEVVEFDDINELSAHKLKTFGQDGLRSIDHNTEKWTQYYLSDNEIQLVRELKAHSGLVPLGSLADTDIGVVTGMNEFFLLTEGRISEAGLKRFSRPSVTRSNHLPGIIFTAKDWKENARLGHPVHLLELPSSRDTDLPLHARDYIRQGEASGAHLGYKCRIRKFWYVVPSIYAPTGFMLRQIHHYPKLVVNEASATCTDTIHRVRFRAGVDKRQIAAAFTNSLTFAFTEMLGRSYGGGVLELEPNEADKLPIPIANSACLDAGEVDKFVRCGQIDEVLCHNDRLLLKDGLGLSHGQIATLKSVWQKLRGRRIGRRNRRSKELNHMRGQTLVSQEVSGLNPV